MQTLSVYGAERPLERLSIGYNMFGTNISLMIDPRIFGTIIDVRGGYLAEYFLTTIAVSIGVF
jgi:hypothetical protein